VASEKKNLVVLFPGTGYTVSSPLLYYADFKYYVKGYDNIKINYGECVRKDISWDEIIENIKVHVSEQIKNVDFSKYEDVLFVSKSLGTIIAGWLADKLAINIRHIYLTPLGGTLQYIKSGKNISIVIAGTKDNFMEACVLAEHCEREKIKLELIENTGHSLEIAGDMNVNIDILKRIVELY